jgi:hypothetical protein
VMTKRRASPKTDLDSLLRILRDGGWNPELEEKSYRDIMGTSLQAKNLPLACVATEIAIDENPITLRGLMYRLVSAGWLPSTDKEHYARTGRVLTVLREIGIVDFGWIVDNVRCTEKPSSWAGVRPFIETVQWAYRKDFWAQLPHYVHVICEKDAVAGTIAPVTREYDVRLSPIRGYVSLSFAHEIAETWNRIDKPIFAFYVGDFDPSGFDLERDVQEKLRRYCSRPFEWRRLGVNAEDFDAFNLIPLKPKSTDSRYRRFLDEHGTQCAELDALPPTELRRRIEQAILSHVDLARWGRLKETERIEKEAIAAIAWPA